MRIRVIHVRSLLVVAAAAALIGACGGAASQLEPIGALDADVLGTPALDVGALDALIAGEATSADEALAASFALEVAGYPTEALGAVLNEDIDWSGPEHELARAARIYSFRAQVPGFESLAAEWASDDVIDAHPFARMLRRELEFLIGYRDHRYAMSPGLYDGSPYGAPVDWRFVGPFSSLDVLDFDTSFAPVSDDVLADEYDVGALVVETRRVPSSAGGVSLPVRGSGIYFAEAFVETTGSGDVLVTTDSTARYRVTIDGEAVAERTLDDEYGPSVTQSRVKLSEGLHRVLVRFATDGGDSHLFLRVTPEGDTRVTHFGASPGTLARGEVVARSPVASDSAQVWSGIHGSTLSWLVRAEAVWLTDDAWAAELLIDEALEREPGPLESYWIDRLAVSLRHRSQSERSDLGIAALREAVGSWDEAAGAQLELGRLLFDEGQVDTALELLAPLELRRAENYAVHRALSDIYLDHGWYEMSERSLRRAIALYPRHCGLVGDTLDAMSMRGEVMSPESIPAEWQVCDSVRRRLASEWYRPRGMLEEALEISQLLVSRNPDDGSYYEYWLDAELALGNEDGAIAALEAGREYLYDPLDVLSVELDLAMRAGADHDELSRLLDEIEAELPQRIRTHSQRSFLNQTPLLSDLRIDGLQVVREFQESGAQYEGNVVYVHDYGAYRYFDDGSGLMVVHQIIQLLTRDSLGSYGEVGVPGGATLLTVRTIKSDGTVLVPEDIAGKDSISMPNLEIGDFIELEWVEPMSGPLFERASVDSGRFYFQIGDGPLHRSIARYEYPSAWADDVQVDLRNVDGSVERETRGDSEILTITVDESFPPAPEPRAVHPDEWLPSVLFAYGDDWESKARAYANAIARSTVTTPAMEELAKELAGDGTVGERARAIFRYVNDEIIDIGGFFSEPAAWAMSSGEGDRQTLAFALLAAAELDPQVLFVRPAEQDQSDLVVPQADVYDLTVLRVPSRGNDIWLEPSFDDYPFNYLRTEAQGQDALIVTGDSAGSFVTTPTWGDEQERNHILLEIAVAETGEAVVQATETIPVRSASSFRTYLRYVEDQRELVQQLEGGLSSSFPGATIDTFEVENQDSPDEPVILRYSFSSPGFAVTDGDDLVFDGTIFERPLATAYASVPTRTTAMLVEYPVIETMEVRIEAPEGYSFSDVPDDVSTSFHGSSFRRRFDTRAGGSQAVIVRETDIGVQRVEVDEYDAFVDFVTEIDASARIRLELTRD